ncbi:hypothetical protein BDC45DRAFT_525197, partial [Circinella umbellata]
MVSLQTSPSGSCGTNYCGSTFLHFSLHGALVNFLSTTRRKKIQQLQKIRSDYGQFGLYLIMIIYFTTHYFLSHISVRAKRYSFFFFAFSNTINIFDFF